MKIGNSLIFAFSRPWREPNVSRTSLALDYRKQLFFWVRVCEKIHRVQRLRFSRTGPEPDRIPNARRVVPNCSDPDQTSNLAAWLTRRCPSFFCAFRASWHPRPNSGNSNSRRCRVLEIRPEWSSCESHGVGMQRPKFSRRWAIRLAGGTRQGPGHESTEGSGWRGVGGAEFQVPSIF